ncbi:uncharacterized protein LODBEIA_P49880 [Lodderomyces beijingensis]|uniref:TAP42-like protein n=1 Tax=Lodderomyces beijingensis TaxID=1775926 RepID=A0ABP0ZRK3_9ASCO
MDQLTVTERYKRAVAEYESLSASSQRQDSMQFQTKLVKLISEFQLLLRLVESLSLFSENELIAELSTSYIQYFNIWYYLCSLFTKLLIKDGEIAVANKVDHLAQARTYLFDFLTNVANYEQLTKDQTTQLDMLKRGEEIVQSPQLKRSEKIEKFKKERELKAKLDTFASLKGGDDDNGDGSSGFDDYKGIDEEIVRQMYLDQLQLHILNAFDMAESIAMELQVLAHRPVYSQNDELARARARAAEANGDERMKQKKGQDPTGFTTRVESVPNPNGKKNISDLINRQGKILQPFTITGGNKREALKSRVFGTGQVLPSMSVDEYLEYELANGKMMKEEPKIKKSALSDDDEDEDDSGDDEAQLEKRKWDDWKDDNPKGSGNTMGNIG